MFNGTRRTLNPICTQNPVNRSHPFAQGLQNWWLHPQGYYGGKIVRDLMTGASSTINGISTTSGYQSKCNMRQMGSVYYKDNGTYATPPCASSAAVTVMCWAWFDGAFGFPNQKAAVGRYPDATATNPVVLMPTGIGIYDGSFYRELTATTTAPVNQWVHLCGSWKNGAQALYLNSAANGTGTSAFGVATGGTTLMHGSNDAGIYLKGWIHDIRYYTRVLSATEVRNIYLNSLAGYPGLLNRIRPELGSYAATGNRRRRLLAAGVI